MVRDEWHQLHGEPAPHVGRAESMARTVSGGSSLGGVSTPRTMSGGGHWVKSRRTTMEGKEEDAVDALCINAWSGPRCLSTRHVPSIPPFVAGPH